MQYSCFQHLTFAFRTYCNVYCVGFQRQLDGRVTAQWHTWKWHNLGAMPREFTDFFNGSILLLVPTPGLSPYQHSLSFDPSSSLTYLCLTGSVTVLRSSNLSWAPTRLCISFDDRQLLHCHGRYSRETPGLQQLRGMDQHRRSGADAVRGGTQRVGRRSELLDRVAD